MWGPEDIRLPPRKRTTGGKGRVTCLHNTGDHNIISNDKNLEITHKQIKWIIEYTYGNLGKLILSENWMMWENEHLLH